MSIRGQLRDVPSTVGVVVTPLSPDLVQNLGVEWSESLRDLAFIGALDVPEETVEQLCARFRTDRWRFRISTDEQVRIAFAVTVVNLAYYSPDDGITRYICRKLGYDPEDRNTWTSEIAEPVCDIIQRYFHEPPRTGPWRYVTPIRKQAGISAASAASFAQTLARLIKRCGYSFTAVEFEDAVGALDEESAPALDFLKSTAGYRFCLDLVRNVRNIHDGITDWDALRAAPGFRGHLIDRLHSALEKPTSLPRGQALAKPRLILDTTVYRLAVLFGDTMTFARYRWEDNRPVQRPKYLLEAGDIGATLRGTIRSVSGETTSWALQTWSPDVSQWAAFRPDDGLLLQTAGMLRPGRYVIAAPADHVPQQNVHYDIGEFEMPGRDEAFYLVDCTLEEGFSDEAIGLVVGGAAQAAPMLRFAKNASPVCGTSNVFAGRPPDIEIVNWSADFCERFALVLTAAGARQAIGRPELERSGRVRLSPLRPGRVSLTIEPIGYAPAEFVDAPLDLVIVDAGTAISVPAGVNGIDVDVDVLVSPPRAIHVVWRQSAVERGQDGGYTVPAPLDLVDGRAIVGSDISFDVSLRIPRVHISGVALDRGILWTERLRETLGLEVELSDDEIGTNPELIVATGEQVTPILMLPTVPKSRRVRLSTADLRDGLKGFDDPVGRLGVRLDKRGGKVALSGASVANFDAVDRWLRGDLGDDELQEVLLPREPRDLLHRLRYLRVRPITLPNPSELPARLAGTFADLAACAAAFDDGCLPDKAFNAQESLLAKLRWYLDARRELEVGDPDLARAALLAAATPSNWDEVPYDRWVLKAEEALRRLGSVSTIDASLREWVTLCRAREWELADETDIGQREGGAALTEGAKHYYFAVEDLAKGCTKDARLRLGTARDCFRKAADQAAGENMRCLARILEALCFIHWRHPSARDTVSEMMASFGTRWRVALLQLAAAVELDHPPFVANAGLRLADLSPHALDEQLLERGYGKENY
jgi:hypothetical protein